MAPASSRCFPVRSRGWSTKTSRFYSGAARRSLRGSCRCRVLPAESVFLGAHLDRRLRSTGEASPWRAEENGLIGGPPFRATRSAHSAPPMRVSDPIKSALARKALQSRRSRRAVGCSDPLAPVFRGEG